MYGWMCIIEVWLKYKISTQFCVATAALRISLHLVESFHMILSNVQKYYLW